MIRFPVFLAALLVATPALAFDALWRDLAIVPADPTSNHPAFYYSAPDKTVDLRDSVLISGRQELLQAMMDPGRAFQLTGVDFSTVYAVFDTGVPPQQVAILHGLSGFASNAPTVLGERGFASSEQHGYTVLAKGEDLAIDLNNRVIGEPFSGAIGKEYRLAIADDSAIVAFSTEQMAGLTSALANPDDCDTCTPWRDLLDAVEAAAGDGAVLDAAMGFSVAALQARPVLPQEGDQIAIPKTAVPPFFLSIFAVTRDAAHHPTAYLSLLFPDAAVAKTGAKALAVGMQALFDEVDEAGSPMFGGKVTPVVKDAVATITVTFDHPHGAALAYNRWIQMILNGSFTLLSPL